MKKPFIAFALLTALSAPVHAELVYQCMVKDNTNFELDRNAETDTWTLNISIPGQDTQKAVKKGNNLGIGERLHSAEGVATAEIYFYTGGGDYTLGRMDRQGVISGYIQVQKKGQEEIYEECLKESFYANFSTPHMFDNFTNVD